VLIDATVNLDYEPDDEGNRFPIEQSAARVLKLGPIQTRDARHLFGLSRSIHRICTADDDDEASE